MAIGRPRDYHVVQGLGQTVRQMLGRPAGIMVLTMSSVVPGRPLAHMLTEVELHQMKRKQGNHLLPVRINRELRLRAIGIESLHC